LGVVHALVRVRSAIGVWREGEVMDEMTPEEISEEIGRLTTIRFGLERRCAALEAEVKRLKVLCGNLAKSCLIAWQAECDNPCNSLSFLSHMEAELRIAGGGGGEPV
jgi:uncharacterized small protein (DUF1192 family)